MNPAATQQRSLPDPYGWIRGVSFDMTLIVGVAALALITGWVYVAHPPLFPYILFLDLWFLGYHHVVATFTRLTFDLESFQQHKFLVIWVPIIIVLVCVPIVLLTGPWVLATAYLYWQWYHYMRQSYGIARIYQRKVNREVTLKDNILENGVIYLIAIWGIMNRSFQNPGRFLGMELKVIPVSPLAMQIIAGLTMAVLTFWLFDRFVALRRGKFDLAHTLFLASHILVFTVGYLLIENINYGWLVLNIWHNAQYILIVWMYNNNRFKTGVDPNHQFLSTISQRKNMVAYFAVCLAIATIVYKSIDWVLAYFTVSTLPLAIIVYQTINFHHYIVDGVVWKIRQKPIRQTFGIAH